MPLEPRERSFDEVDSVGLVIGRPSGPLHCGFLFRLDYGPARLLHLAWHHRLMCEAPDERYRWVEIAGLDPENKFVLAGYLQEMGADPPSIPYSFNSEGVAFDPVTRSPLPLPIGRGLTCATFVMAALRLLKHDLLDEANWPTRSDDAEWQQSIVDLMRRTGVPEDHINALEAGSKRYRPDEVVGASAEQYWPVAFVDARRLADEIISELGSA